MNLQPRDIASLDYATVFDEGFIRTRLNELTQGFMTQLEFEEKDNLKEKEFAEAIKSKKPPKPFQWRELSQGEKAEKYLEKARKLAETILEQERQIYVDARAERDKNMLVEIAKKLKYLTWTVDEEGKPKKVKLIVERGTRLNSESTWVTCDVQYVGDHDFEKLGQINILRNRLDQLKEFVPYYSEEIKKLYDEAIDLVTLEYEYKEEKKAKK